MKWMFFIIITHINMSRWGQRCSNQLNRWTFLQSKIFLTNDEVFTRNLWLRIGVSDNDDISQNFLLIIHAAWDIIYLSSFIVDEILFLFTSQVYIICMKIYLCCKKKANISTKGNINDVLLENKIRKNRDMYDMKVY